jgi:hypothetical protein
MYYELMLKLRPHTILSKDDPRIGRVFTGERFNKEYRSAKFIKVLDKTMYHYNFQYKEGLNSDTKTFSETPRSCDNGLHFFRIITDYRRDIPYYMHYMTLYGNLVAEVEIPNYARVLVKSSTEFKTDHLVLSNIRNLTEL